MKRRTLLKSLAGLAGIAAVPAPIRAMIPAVPASVPASVPAVTAGAGTIFFTGRSMAWGDPRNWVHSDGSPANRVPDRTDHVVINTSGSVRTGRGEIHCASLDLTGCKGTFYCAADFNIHESLTVGGVWDYHSSG